MAASITKQGRQGRGRLVQGRDWKLEDAKARFSEVVRLARSEGPQRVSVRGKDAVVVMSAEEFARLMPPDDKLPFVEFMASLGRMGLGQVDVTRDRDTGRDVEL